MTGGPNIPEPEPTGSGESAEKRPTRPVRSPQSLMAAIRLMYVGAGLQALAIVFTFAARIRLRDQMAEQEPTLSPEEIDAAVQLHLLSVAVIDVLAIAMWIWMAFANGRGHEWARIVASVLAPLNIAFTLFSLSQAAGAMIVVRLVIIALSGAILFLLYRPDASAYYRVVSSQARG